uniref:Uncharacterized protein n=1 Tax=Photinus pyralis TaxID=7054 RepID=A0A1Y1KK83_PHOPY
MQPVKSTRIEFLQFRAVQVQAIQMGQSEEGIIPHINDWHTAQIQVPQALQAPKCLLEQHTQRITDDTQPSQPLQIGKRPRKYFANIIIVQRENPEVAQASETITV